MPASKSDYIRWRDDPVTLEFREAMMDKIDGALTTLRWNAGLNARNDGQNVGLIDGVQWLLDWQPEFISEETDEDVDSQGSQDSD